MCQNISNHPIIVIKYVLFRNMLCLNLLTIEPPMDLERDLDGDILLVFYFPKLLVASLSRKFDIMKSYHDNAIAKLNDTSRKIITGL